MPSKVTAPKNSRKSPKAPRAKSTPIAAHKHAATRKNIPTEELRDWVADDEKNPKTILYPRDPSLDPQLVWKGKDEQDSQPLEVPAVPIYIQELIQPQAIIENVRALPSPNGRGAGGEGQQLALFADFNGLDFTDRVDFYHHDQHWTNRMILGDSLFVMNSLAEKEGLKGQVQMIYLDPPYGIKFGSNWQVSTRKRDVKDGRIEDATRQPEQVKAFRDTWKLGIHSYLSYLRDRLTVARELLTESGSVFVQIGDENVHLVRALLDEVFGSENFVSQIVYQTSSGRISDGLDSVYDSILWYAKNREQTKIRKLYRQRSQDQVDKSYNFVDADGIVRRLSTNDEQTPETLARRFKASQVYSQTPSESSLFGFHFRKNIYYPSPGSGWRTSKNGLERLVLADRLMPQGRYLTFKLFDLDYPFVQMHNVWMDTATSLGGAEKVYVVQTNVNVVQRCMLMTTDPGDLVLDPTCGSGTTAYVAEQWGRRWITIDTSRVAIALARTRLMAGRYPYYLLQDSPEGAKKQNEITPHPQPLSFEERGAEGGMRFGSDLKKGFVYKRVPHVTLKSIANNQEIDVIHARYQEQLEPLRAEINRIAKQNWEEWEIPRDVQDVTGFLPNLSRLLERWWELRRARQKEIDESIAKRADIELLYDQPYEDNKRLRVTGPFTVESLSPHRVLAADENLPKSEMDAKQLSAVDQFETVILENLAKAGVQNTRRNERLTFERLEPYAGAYIHAKGIYSDKKGESKTVGVCIGPEHGTVSADMIKNAAKEARRGYGFDMLVVCGFAFDALAGETASELMNDLPKRDERAPAARETQIGNLPIMLARMNPDLAMGDELLKKTGAGNLFMVFGEPDIELKTLRDGKLTVTLQGVDVYDPTTGQIRSSSTDDIACWFIDTNYNQESFFVRHAYFTGADEPYEKLKRALRAEIDEGAWSTLYATTSQPFDKPATNKIAVKVINHYGDEVLKVYAV